MMSRLRFMFPLFGLVLAAFLAFGSAALAVEQVTWDDLAPPFDESKDPFRALNEAQQDALYELVWGRGYRRNSGEDTPLSEEELAARQKLEEDGLDPDALLAEVDAFDQQIATWNKTLVDDLDGQEIRIAGYALPLEFSGTAITEFLLVPYIGACIHVPPPPANQIVYVQVAEGYESKGLYAPVWVTGRISNRHQSLLLSLVDGSSNVSVGYGLEAAEIEPYE